MTFPELLAEIKKVAAKEIRFDMEDSLELVTKADKLKELHSVLERFFGKAAKPVGQNPTKEISQLAEEYGGIRSDQTFYYAKKDGLAYYGMLWPWGDRMSVTVRLFSKKNK